MTPENLTFHISREVRSYRDLPKLLYHFQTKERDEPRPRAGVLRTREFIMKDAYSFDRDAAGLDESYGLYIHAYDHIRPARARVVPGGVGRGHDGRPRCTRVHGALPGGENDVALSDAGHAANVEVASATPQPVEPAGTGGRRSGSRRPDRPCGRSPTDSVSRRERSSRRCR